MASKNKDEGNEVFKAGNLQEAAARYMKALGHIQKAFDMSSEDKVEADKVSLSCFLNLSQCYIKLATVEDQAGRGECSKL
jgi:tetratricopeptide (TPR) repeat protein